MVGPISRSDLAVRIRLERRHSGTPSFTLDVVFVAAPGITIMFGPSGAGKSTVLDCIAGLARPDEGSISAGSDILFDSASRVNLPPQHRRVAYMFQRAALFPHMTVEQNVAYGLNRLPAAERASRVEQILVTMHIEGLRQRKPSEISGGEAQRVALARSLVTLPRVLLVDEPLIGLDAVMKSSIVDDLRAWNAAQGIPILYVTHNRDEVDALGERVVALDRGEIIGAGTASNVLDAPRRLALAQAAGFENLLRGEVLDIREDEGVMRVGLNSGAAEPKGPQNGAARTERVEIEVPVGFTKVGRQVAVAIRAGDILIATQRPFGLSARNILAGRILSLDHRGRLIAARVDAGVVFLVHLTPGAVSALELTAGAHVWLVLKTYSCHLLSE
jgi:molybdate transport system ATP-binding protein